MKKIILCTILITIYYPSFSQNFEFEKAYKYLITNIYNDATFQMLHLSTFCLLYTIRIRFQTVFVILDKAFIYMCKFSFLKWALILILTYDYDKNT